MGDPRHILLLSSRDQPIASTTRPVDSVAPVAERVFEVLAARGDVKVVHRTVFGPDELSAAVNEHPGAVVFNLCEGLGGQSQLEVLAASLLERLGASFTGSPAAALRRCLHKPTANHVLGQAGLPVPALVRVVSPDRLPTVSFPAIVKPEREDGSTAITARSVVHDVQRLREQVAEVIAACRQPAVVQRYIPGRELAVALLGWPVPRALPPGEILFHDLPAGHPHILTFDAKWHEDSPAYLATPSVAADLDPAVLQRVVALGRRTFEALGLRDYGRVDLRLDDHGDLFVIDVNPNCDLSEQGGFCRAARRAGLDHGEVLVEIVRGAGRRGEDLPHPLPAPQEGGMKTVRR